jgi:hypothetical protein
MSQLGKISRIQPFVEWIGGSARLGGSRAILPFRVIFIFFGRTWSDLVGREPPTGAPCACCPLHNFPPFLSRPALSQVFEHLFPLHFGHAVPPVDLGR